MEIEFIEHPAEIPPDLAPVEAARRPDRYLGLLAGVTFAAAAALAAAAPFQRLFRIEFRSRGFSEIVTSDAWGRTKITLSEGTTDPQHGGRYGIVLAVLAGMCALLVVATAASVLRSVAVPAIAVVGAVVICGAAAAATAMMWLDATSVLDNARAVPSHQSGDTFSESISVEAGYGPAIWYGVAAAGCVGVGAGVAALYRRHRRAAGTPAPPPDPVPPTVPDHELGEPLTW